MLAALLLAALPQQGWQVEELPALPVEGPADWALAGAGDRLVLLGGPWDESAWPPQHGGAVYVLDPAGEGWERVAALAPRQVHAVAGAADRVAVLAGNWAAAEDWRIEVLDLATGAWRTAAVGTDCPSPEAALVLVGDTLHVLGRTGEGLGTSWGDPYARAFDLSDTDRGAPVSSRELGLPGGVVLGAAHFPLRNSGVAIQGGGAAGAAVYVGGGADLSKPPAFGLWKSDFLRLDPQRGVWSRLSDLPEADAYGPVAFGATELLLFGSTCWSFNTVTGQWVDRGPELLPAAPASSMVRWGERIVQLTIEADGAPPRVLALSLPKRAAALGAVDLGVLVGYLLLLVGLGAWFARREKDTEDFFLAGQRIPWWAAGLSLFATQLSAITFLGTPAVSYATDWMLLPSWFGILFFAPLAVKVFLPLYRRRPMRTVYTWLEWRFGVPARLFGSLSFIVFQLLRMGVVVYLPSLALSTATGIAVWQCVVLMGVLATLYTVLGGMEAVVWTDVLQTGVLLVGVGATLWVVFSALDDPGAAWASAVEAGKLRTVGGGWSTVEAATWSLVLGGLFLQFGPYTADQAMVQRYLTTKDEKAAARGIWLNGWMSVPAGALFILVGTALWLYYRARPEALDLGLETDAVFPLFLARELPTGVSGLVIAGLFAAAMSTLDSGMHAIATTCTTDWYERLSGRVASLRQARGATLVAGAAATAIALLLAASGILSSLLFFLKTLGLLTSGVAGVFLLGVLSKRAHTAGALTGAAVGIGALAWVAFATPTDLFVYPLVGIPTTVAAGWLASRVLSPRSPSP